PTASSFMMDENVIRYQGRIEGNQLVFENILFDADGNGFDTFGISYSAKAKEVSQTEIVNNSEVNAYPNPTNLNETVTVTYRFDNILFDADGNGVDTVGISYSAKAKEVSQTEIVNNSEVNAYPSPTNLNESVIVTYSFVKPTSLNTQVFSVDGKFIGKKAANNT